MGLAAAAGVTGGSSPPTGGTTPQARHGVHQEQHRDPRTPRRPARTYPPATAAPLPPGTVRPTPTAAPRTRPAPTPHPATSTTPCVPPQHPPHQRAKRRQPWAKPRTATPNRWCVAGCAWLPPAPGRVIPLLPGPPGPNRQLLVAAAASWPTLHRR